MKKRAKILALFFVALVMVSTATGEIIYVDADANGTDDGSSWADAYNYLQDALADANPSSKPVEIRVAEGIYKPDEDSAHPSGSGDRTAMFQLINGVTLKGRYAGFGEPDPNARDIELYETILSGDLDGNDIDVNNIDVNDLWDLCNEQTRAENNYHVVTASGTDETSVLDGFTISGGNANGSGSNDDGGGMYNSGGSPTLNNCTFEGNSARWDGGGMHNRSGSSPILVNCIFSGNSARVDGGGMHNGRNSNPTLTGCTFSGNSVYSDGGGMSNSDSSPTLTDCTFIGNRAYIDGGGMDSHTSVTGQTPCNLTLTDCTFIENAAGIFGGGMSSYEASATLTNCIFSGNSAEYYGGGMFNHGTCPMLTNCIFSENSADKGGGMHNWYHSNATLANCTFSGNSAECGGAIWNQRNSNPTLTSCILWGNAATQGDNIYLALYQWAGQTFTAGITVSYSDVQGGEAGVHVETGCTLNWGEGNIDADPLLAMDGYHLRAYSPCINAGDPLYTPSFGETDIDGEPRVMGGRVDMGIDEFTSTPTPFIGISPTELMFYATQGGSNPKSQILSIRNIGSGTLNWEIAEDYPWLQVYPPNGESTGHVNEVTLSVDISGLDPCVHNCQLTITGNEAANSPQMVAITLYLGVVLRVPSEYTTIQAAIDAAKDGDTVLVADGIYTGEGNRDIVFRGKAITVRSENGPENCIIDCNGTEADPHRGFHFHKGEDADSILNGFTITNGYASGNYAGGGGGAVICEHSSPLITNCIIANNLAEHSGGGIACWEQSRATITNCTFIHNIAKYGGGMRTKNSNTTVLNCVFTNNYAEGVQYDQSSGGGMYASGGSPVLTGCTFNGNEAYHDGGGMHIEGSSPKLTDCTFSSNSAKDYGAGMANYFCSPTITNCTFSDNWVQLGEYGEGGAIYNYDSDSVITNCLITGNSVVNNGGGIANWMRGTIRLTGCTLGANSAGGRGRAIYSRDNSASTLTNCILWDGGNEIWTAGNSVVSVTYSDIQSGWVGQGNIDADPCFISPGYWDPNGTPYDANDDFWINGDYHLLAVSPCIDAGDPNYIAEPNETDLDGKPRIIYGRIDMGAYEYEPSIPAEVRIVPRSINLASVGKWIICYIWLAEDYDVADIEPNSVLLEDEIQAESLQVDEQEQVAIVRFSRSEVQSALGGLEPGDVELTISGELSGGTRFEGTDTIRVIDKGGKK